MKTTPSTSISRILKKDRPKAAQVGAINLERASSAVGIVPASSAESSGEGFDDDRTGNKGSGASTRIEAIEFTPSGDEAVKRSPKPRTLEEALQDIAARKLVDDERLRELRSDIKVAARCVWDSSLQARSRRPLTAADLPCDPLELRPMLQQVLPAKCWPDKPGQISDDTRSTHFQRVRHRWSSIRSSISKVLRLTGWMEPKRSPRLGLKANWTQIADTHVHPTQKALVRNFAIFCESRGTTPDQVCIETVEAFRGHLMHHTLDPDVTTTVNALRAAWNRASKSLDGAVPTLPSRKRPKSYVLPNDALPTSFLADLEDYLATLLRPDPFDGARLGRPRSPVTVTCLREIIKRFASIALTAGLTSADITTVSDVARPSAVRAILEDQYHRLGKGAAWPPGAVTVAAC